MNALDNSLGKLRLTLTRSNICFKSRLLFWLLLTLIILFGTTQASVARLGDSLSIDEPFSANLVHLPLDQMLEALRYDTTPIVYPLLLRVWTHTFGESELALRSLSLLLFGLTVLTVGITAKIVIGRPAGLIAALLLTTSTPLSLEYAATARQYMLLCLHISLTTLICFRLMKLVSLQPHCSPQSLTVSAEAVFCLLLIGLNVSGLLTHAIYIFFMGAYSFAAIWVDRRTFALLAACSAVSFIIYLALWWPILSVTILLPSWMPKPGLANLGSGFLNLFGAQKSLLLLVYLVGLLLFRFRQVLTHKLYAVSLTIIGVASLLPFAVSQFRPVYFEFRTPIIFLPIVCILAAALMQQLGIRTLTGVVVALLVAGSTVRSVQKYFAPDPYPAKASIRYVVDNAECSDTLVLGGLSLSEVEYYLRRFNAPDCIRRETFPADTMYHPGWIDVPGLMQRKDELAAEAAATATRLAGEKGSRVWFFSDSRYGYEITEILKVELDRQMALRQALDLRGSFFDSILVYSTDGAGSVPASMQ